MEGELVTEIGNKISNNNFIIIFNIEKIKKIRCSEDTENMHSHEKYILILHSTIP